MAVLIAHARRRGAARSPPRSGAARLQRSTGRGRGLLRTASASPISPELGRPLRARRTTQTAEPKPLETPGEQPRLAQVAEVGRDRRARLDPDQLPRLRDLRPDPDGQARRRRRQGARRQPVPARRRRRSSCSAPTCARARSPGPTRPRREACFDAVNSGTGDRPPLQHGHYRADTIMLIRAGGGHAPQALDPPRHARRHPRPGAAEDQRGLRLRRREARGQDGRGASSGIDIDHVAIVDFDGFRKFIDAIGGVNVDLPDSRLLEHLRAAPST